MDTESNPAAKGPIVWECCYVPGCGTWKMGAKVFELFVKESILLILSGLAITIITLSLVILGQGTAGTTPGEENFYDHIIRVLYALLLVVEATFHIASSRTVIKNEPGTGLRYIFEITSRPWLYGVLSYALLLLYVGLDPWIFYKEQTVLIGTNREMMVAVFSVVAILPFLHWFFHFFTNSDPKQLGWFAAMGQYLWHFIGFLVIWFGFANQMNGDGIGFLPTGNGTRAVLLTLYLVVGVTYLFLTTNVMFDFWCCGGSRGILKSKNRTSSAYLHLVMIVILLVYPVALYITSFRSRMWYVFGISAAVLFILLIRIIVAAVEQNKFDLHHKTGYNTLKQESSTTQTDANGNVIEQTKETKETTTPAPVQRVPPDVLVGLVNFNDQNGT